MTSSRAAHASSQARQASAQSAQAATQAVMTLIVDGFSGWLRKTDVLCCKGFVLLLAETALPALDWSRSLTGALPDRRAPSSFG